MAKEERERRIIAAVISLVVLEKESGETIEPTLGRDEGSSWSKSHRRMAMGKTSWLKARTVRSIKR
tara:strand:+ start:193 stop:390 length:198 start_codon:yes stop_codon:yes gene_type:complete